MNIRKPVNYNALFRGLDKIPFTDQTQMETYCEIGCLVSARPEKGAAVAAAEYLQQRYPDASGFSPRNIRRMRDFYKKYVNTPNLLKEAMQIGWTQNITILDADLTTEERTWYIRAVHQFGWSKSELIRQLEKSDKAQVELDGITPLCYSKTDNGEREDFGFDKNFIRVPRQYLQESNGGIHNEGYDSKGRPEFPIRNIVSSHQHGGDRQPGLSSSPPYAIRAWNRLFWKSGRTIKEQRLREIRFVDWYGPEQSSQYISNLRRRLCEQNTLTYGVYQPAGRYCGSVVHKRFQQDVVRC